MNVGIASPTLQPIKEEKSPNHKKKKKDNKNKNKNKNEEKTKKSSNDKDEEEEEEEDDDKKKKELEMKDLIAENFVLLTEIGKGAFGVIYLSYDLRDDVEVALKKELKRPGKSSQLRTEAKVYQSLLNIQPGQDISGTKVLGQDVVQGVPKFFGMGELDDSYYLIMDFLGPNLLDLFNFCGTKKFTISTVCLIALQMINRIENIHKHHYLHRDIKPENFLIGTEEKTNIIFLVDFGLSKRYKNSKNYQHIPFRDGRMLIGTARYVSINTHLGIEQSRRDDLESIGYVLVFFLKGSLPWQGLKAGNDKYSRIMEKKLQIPTEILCYGLPDEIVHYLNYCKSLRFEDRPDYDYLRSLFIKLLGTCTTLFGLTKEYLRFDWCFDDPLNSIWSLYSRKKGFGGRNKDKDTPVGSSNKENNEIPSDSNEERSDNKSASDDVNSNENIKLIPVNRDSNNDSSSIAEKSSSHQGSLRQSVGDKKNSKHSKPSQKESKDSEETVEVEFNGLENTQNFGEKYSLEEIQSIFENTEREKIENYISTLINGKKGKETQLETPVMGARNRNKLKDSLDVVSKEIKVTSSSQRKRKVINPQDDEVNLTNNNQELIRNTMRNSKVLTPEEMQKMREYGKIQVKNKKKFVTTIDKNLAKLDGNVHLKKANMSSNNLVNKKKYNNKDNSFINEKSQESQNSSASSNSDDKYSLEKKESKKQDKTDSIIKKGTESSINKTNSSIIKSPELKKKKITLNENSLFEQNSISQSISKRTGKDTLKNSNIEKKTNEKNYLSIVNPDRPHETTMRSFEAEIMPKISNPEIKERRKSKILEMSNLPLLQQSMKVSKETMIKISSEPLSQNYSIVGDLGSGSYGTVKRVKHKKLGEIRAMKIINKKAENAQTEIDILRKICHPNILNVFEIYEDTKKFYIMSELLEGGELFEAIAQQGSFSEADAAKIMKQILNAVNYLHSKFIVHRDLKPENIMLTSKIKSTKSKYEIKIIDFGTATQFEPHKKMTKFIGTSYYLAPEVLKESYDEKCDVWSCGVIMYILLSGYPPFNGNSNVDIYHNIQNNPPYFSGEEWKDITKEAIDLIKFMLTKNPAKRYSAEMCLNHKWFKLLDDNDKVSKNGMNKKLQIKVINKMSDFVKENRFKQAVLQFISTQFNLKKEEEDLRDLFKQFDKEKKGQITKDVFFQKLCELYGENDGRDICERIFAQLDLDGSGEISYDEFLSAMIDGKKIVTGDRLQKAFKMFDKDGNGRLSVDEIMGVFGGDEATWKKVIAEVDLNNDGEVDFEEFKQMMNNMDAKMVKK